MKKYLFALIMLWLLFIAVGCTEASVETDLHKGTMTVHYIDVGQGDSTLIRYAEAGEEYNILIDAGHFNKSDVTRYLQSQQVDQIDIAIGTHPDADHIGQLADVIKTFDVKEVWLSGNSSTSETFVELLEEIDAKGVSYHEPRMGEEYELGSLQLEILYPKTITGDSNAESISLKMTYGEIDFVFTGDAEKESELEMIESGENLEAEILHLGHHGSNTSTHPQFLRAIQPEVAIYSAGEDNAYDHPHAEVVDLVQQSNVLLYGTDTSGTIIVTTDGEKYEIQTEEARTISPNALKEPVSEDVSSNCIDLNTASVEELQEIVHIGEERAQEIIDLRPFQSIKELLEVTGIGPSRYDEIIVEGKACVRGGK